MLAGNKLDVENSQYPLHPPTGERTRKTYDFTSKMFKTRMGSYNCYINWT